MATIRRYPLSPLRHLRSEPIVHTLVFRRGRRVREGRGLALWFRPAITGIAEVPIDDRDATVICKARTADFQTVTMQAAMTYRVLDPGLLADRVDFTLDLDTGRWREQPLEQVDGLLTQLAEQLVLDRFAALDLRTVVRDGLELAREVVTTGLADDQRLRDLGLAVVAVRVQAVRPDAEMEQALRTPVQERVQQLADEARFDRRARAVDAERAIGENELANRLELARRQQDLIAQEGANRRRQNEEAARAERIEAEARAAHRRLEAEAEADALRALGDAEATADGARIAVYRDLPMPVLLGLAARELAGKLERIDHLNLAPDTIGPLLTNLMTATTRTLEAGEERT